MSKALKARERCKNPMSWVMFEYRGTSASGKTKRWVVRSYVDSGFLGTVNWYASWRKYAFTPLPGTVYEQNCLRDIAKFCEDETKKHRVKP